MYAWTLRGSFPFDSPPKSVSKGARFWDFLLSRVRGVLCGISSIPLDLASFGGANLGYGVPMRCSYYPQSRVQIHGAIQEIGSWIWGYLAAGAIHPKLPSLTSLTGAHHRSDWCRGFVGTSWWVPHCLVLLLFRVWSVLELGRSVWWIWDFLAWTSLTGELHQPTRCRGLMWKFLGLARLL
jgi:hypothetical protein